MPAQGVATGKEGLGNSSTCLSGPDVSWDTILGWRRVATGLGVGLGFAGFLLLSGTKCRIRES